MVVGARALLAITPRWRLVVNGIDDHEALCDAQRRLHGVREALADAVASHEAVHDDLDVVLELLLKLRRLR